ncbi:reverse transcriptase domain-containing protein [Tanacetum coccineum]
MDAGGRRSLPKNEGVHRNITHGHNPNQRRNPGYVPSSLRRKYKYSFTYKKWKEANPHLFRKPSTKRGKNGVSRAGKTHTSPRIRRKKAPTLGEHDIEFKGRNSIKGQILADFLAEIPTTESKEKETQDVRNEELVPKDTWKLYIDGASSSDGFEVGLILVNPEGREYTYALRFEFETTNNEAKYEALLAGLRIAKEIKIEDIDIFVDSQLVANQVKGLFEARQPVIKQYLEKTREILKSFKSYSMEHVRERGDGHHQKEGENWMTPIREYPLLGKLPNDSQKARKIRIKAPQYKMIDNDLYRKACQSPWLRCVGPTQAKSIIEVIHQGSCGMHAGPRSVVSKITRLGYYWPSMHNDAKTLIQRCEACQIHSSIPRKPKQEMTSITSAWPFS